MTKIIHLNKDIPKGNEPQFRKLYDELLKKFKDIDYIKEHKVEIAVGKHNFDLDVQNLIAEPDGSFKTHKEARQGWKCNLLIGTDVIYERILEVGGEEGRYLCLTFAFKDMLNAGVRLHHMILLEHNRMLDEIATRTRNAQIMEGKKTDA